MFAVGWSGGQLGIRCVCTEVSWLQQLQQWLVVVYWGQGNAVSSQIGSPEQNPGSQNYF